MSGRYPIETERLLLRPKTPDDLAAMAVLYDDPEVARWLGGPIDRVEARRRFERHVEHECAHGFSMWTLVERASGELVGQCGLQYLEGGPEIEVGWALASSRWGRGYATEAARAALAFGFTSLLLKRIVAVIRPDNVRSRHVAERLGMVDDGRGTYYGLDHVRYALVRP